MAGDVEQEDREGARVELVIPEHVPAQARAVYDVTGAGDTVVAVLAVALGRGVPLPEAVDLANAAAGIVVGKVGTSTVTLDEIRERLA